MPTAQSIYQSVWIAGLIVVIIFIVKLMLKHDKTD